MMNGTQTEKGLKCPKCGSRNIDEFKNAYWFFCRDCGYNSAPSSDRDKAIDNFRHGLETEGNNDQTD